MKATAATRTHSSIITTDGNGEAKNLGVADFEKYCKQFPNRKFVQTITVLSGDDLSRLQAYIFYICAPILIRGFARKGMKFSKKSCIDFMKDQSPVMIVETLGNSGNINQRARSLSNTESDTSTAVEFIQDMQRYAAEHLDEVIPDPQ